MDAVKYLKGLKRMCSSFGNNCKGCGIDELRNELEGCSSIIKRCTEELVAIVEKWSAEHPVKTRQSELLKIIPDAKMLDGVLDLCPERILQEFDCDEKTPCLQCLEKYWLEEME